MSREVFLLLEYKTFKIFLAILMISNDENIFPKTKRIQEQPNYYEKYLEKF